MDQTKIYSFTYIVASLTGLQFLRSQLSLDCARLYPETGKTLINWSSWAEGPQGVKGQKSCPVMRGCRSWAYSTWRRDGLGGGSQQPPTLSGKGQGTEKLKPGSSQQCMVGGDETMGRSWKKRGSDWRSGDPFPLETVGWGSRLPKEAALAASLEVSKRQQVSPEQPGLSSDLVLPEWEAALKTCWPSFPRTLSCVSVLATLRRRLTHLDMPMSQTAQSYNPLFLGDPKWNSNITYVKSKIPSDFTRISPILFGMEKEYWNFAISFREVMSQQTNKGVQAVLTREPVPAGICTQLLTKYLKLDGLNPSMRVKTTLNIWGIFFTCT